MRLINFEFLNNKIELNTHKDLFSPNNVDKGTLAMLKYFQPDDNEKVLDLGCGYGVVGIYIAKLIGGHNVFMVDCDEKAVEFSIENAKLNDVSSVTIKTGFGLEPFENIKFNQILCNPPYHTDFSVAKKFIESGYRHLLDNGKMILVVKRLDWYKNKLSNIFGGVRVYEEDGYYILISEKRLKLKKDKIKKTTKKHLKRITKKE